MAERIIHPRKTVIHNVHVFDGESITAPQTVVIDGDRIGSDPCDATETIDGEHGVLIPGLIDAHVHVLSTAHLRQLARHGVTTALDMAMYPAPKIPQLRGGIDGLPCVKTAGVPATKVGSVHSCVLPLPREAFLKGPEEAECWVRNRIDEGSDYIKIIADVPGPDQMTMNAITAAAHRHGKMVVAHAASHVPFNMALDAQVDIVTHLSLDRAVDTSMAERMVAGKITAVPTLTMMKETSKTPPLSAIVSLLLKPTVLAAVARNRRNGLGKQTYVNARASIAALRRAGVTILAGTDCHEEPNSPFHVPHGESLHLEMELLVEAGLSHTEALRAATVLPATTFGLHDRGRVEVGQRADLVLLRNDPTKDIRTTRDIRRVWCGGVDIER